MEAVCFDPAAFGSTGGGRGLWMIVPTDAAAPEGEMPTLTTTWLVIWVWNDGSVIEGPKFFSTQDPQYENQSNIPEITGWHLFDFDGDGLDELLLPIRQFEHSGEGPRKLWIFTVSNTGSIAPYETRVQNPVWAEDVDEDGRPDLMFDPLDSMVDAPYPVHTSVNRDTWRVAHSLPDGTFSTTDDVAQGGVP